MRAFSNDGERLWHAILRRPHSRRPRLVYADWLDDHGDPRAEFIRLQLGAVPRDPWREAELLRAHELEWLGPMSAHARDWHFSGGLLEWVCVETPDFLAHAEEWVRRPGLLGVHLRRLKGHVRAVAEHPALRRLPFLFLGDNELTTDDLGVLLASRHLRPRSLYLQSNRLDNDAFGLLLSTPALAGLRELCLCNNRFRAGLALPAGASLPRLRRIHLTPGQLGGAEVARLLDGHALPSLQHIDAEIDEPRALGALLGAPGFARLRALWLTVFRAGEAAAASVAASPATRGLRWLGILFHQAAGRAAEALAGSANLAGLRSLALHGVEDPEALGHLGRSTALRGLRTLEAHVVHGGGASAAAEVRRLFGGRIVRQLRSLSVDGVPADDDAVRALASQGALPLRRLRHRGHFSRRASAASWGIAADCLPRLERLELENAGPGTLAAFAGKLPMLSALRFGAAGPEDAVAAGAFPLLRDLRLACQAGAGDAVLSALACVPAVGRWRRLALDGAGEGIAPILAATRSLDELELARIPASVARAVAEWPGLAGLRRLALRLASDALAEGGHALASSPHWGRRPRARIEMEGLGALTHETEKAVARELRARLGGRVATEWRADAKGVVMGRRAHGDT